MNFKFKDVSLWALLFVNIATIFIALWQSWNFSIVIWVYLFQSFSIGFFNFFKILGLKNFSTDGFKINNSSVLPSKGTKIFTAIFFAFHYNFFLIGYFFFLSLSDFSGLSQNFLLIIIASAGFFINHGFSYFYNKKNDSNTEKNIGNLMFKPYTRIIPLHFIIIFGLFFSPTSNLIFFLVLKTVADLWLHNMEHKIDVKVE